MVRTQVIAAAARAALPLLNGPVHEGAVLGAFTRAVIVSVPTPDGPRVLSLLAPTVAGVPNGLRLTGADAWILAQQTPGDAVFVGAGRILLGGTEVLVVRSWPCRVRQLTVATKGIDAISDMILGRAASQEPGVPVQLVSVLESALHSALESAVEPAARSALEPAARSAGVADPLRAAVRRLVGRGLGLTPGGDDVIAGALLGLHATGATAGARLPAAAALEKVALEKVALEKVTERTTLLSADLLRLAAQGDACLEVLGVLRAAPRSRDVLRPNTSALTVVIDRLLSVGHTSGADLATGLAIGLRVGARAGTRQRAEVR